MDPALTDALKGVETLPREQWRTFDRDSLLKGSSDLPWIPSAKLALLVNEITAIRRHNEGWPAKERARAAAAAAVVDDDDTDEEGAAGGGGRPDELEDGEDVCGMRMKGGVKAIVFSSFTAFLDMVGKSLTDAGLRFARLDGSMSQPVRERNLTSFRTDPHVTVMLISLKAGGTGLNLTEASVCYLCDPWWNGATEEQAWSRIHRLGQKRQVYVRRLIASNTIEEDMLIIQSKKQKMADMAFASSAGMLSATAAATKLTEEDLMLIFQRGG